MADEVDAYIRSLSTRVKARLAEAVQKEADRLASQIREEAPVSEDERPGELRESVKVEDGKHQIEKLVVAGGDLTTKNGYDYALAVEYGTRKMPAQPFFWPTVYRERSGIEERLQRELEAALQE